ncbi:class I SAM-dependent methyltransferase [Heyndrickxia acidiproducens]|jgi:site-specific DNA-methyltransferase (adenine-specific)|uniref:class I SAM-dependent methyltransferase n=1 Tax=Heyndrickxia acidiproducens TaxID=1121084 RepID=UPI00037A36EE|nr:class I SAM-dependent methyltransferase [Heyndrickxia acidiproducens]
MSESPIASLYTYFNESAQILQKSLSVTYLEAVAMAGENLFNSRVVQNGISEPDEKQLDQLSGKVDLDKYSREEIRKAYQLAILKGMKENVQANHQMTPDTIGLFMGYFIAKFTSGRRALSILDPAVGTGNLLTTILNQLDEKEITAYGADVDDILIRLAYTGANLLCHDIELFTQDSLTRLFIDPVDIVVCDLPVGYYPNDAGAKAYQLKADEGHSYAHHLFIEQSLRYTRPGGYLFFLIPNHLFESKEAPKLHQFLKEEAIIQAILQLPLTLFKNEQSAKSILVLQKKSEGIQAPEQVLLASLPSLSNQQAVQSVMLKIDAWCRENIETDRNE